MDPSQYLLEVLRKDEEFVLVLGRALEPARFTISSPAVSRFHTAGSGDHKDRARILVEG